MKYLEKIRQLNEVIIIKIENANRKLPEDLTDCDSLRFSYFCIECENVANRNCCDSRKEFYKSALEKGEIEEIRVESEIGYKYT